jgi:hypothetical protein
VPGLLGAQNVVDVENIVAVLIIVAIVLDSFARLGKHATGIPRRLVLEAGVADSVGGGEVYCEGLKRLLPCAAQRLAQWSSKSRGAVDLR